MSAERPARRDRLGLGIFMVVSVRARGRDSAGVYWPRGCRMCRTVGTHLMSGHHHW